LRSNTKGYGDKTHNYDSQNSDITVPSGRESYHLKFSLQAATPETFGYTLLFIHTYTYMWMCVRVCIYIYIYIYDGVSKSFRTES